MGCPVVHFEIGCGDRERTVGFYRDLFGWNISTQGPAAMIDTGVKAGINGHITALGHEPHNYVTIYAQVDDLKRTLDKAATIGGRTIVPPTEVPGVGSFAWMGDPSGNVIGLWKPVAP